MSLYTAAVLLCVLSLTAAARDLAGVRDDLTTAPSTRTLLARRSKNSKPASSTVLSLDLSVNEGTRVVTAGASNGGGFGSGSTRSPSRRGQRRGAPSPYSSSVLRSSTTTTTSVSSPTRSLNPPPVRYRPRGGFFSSSRYGGPVPSRRTPGLAPASSSSAFGFYGSGDADLNNVTGVVRLVEAEELPQGEKDLNHDSYTSASKSPRRPAPKPVSRASASTSFSGVGAVEASSTVRVGRKSPSSPKARSSNGRPRRSPKKRSRRTRG
ncbi:hypothetical protein BSKO_07832 [Bryopsis sp. KO-2023]|nr:hypothetical protein BSKO_07832 [Bryopsis sp. KO-2023]